MSKRKSRSAVFRGKFLNTLRNQHEGPRGERDEQWARRAIGFATIKFGEAERLVKEAFGSIGGGTRRASTVRGNPPVPTTTVDRSMLRVIVPKLNKSDHLLQLVQRTLDDVERKKR